MSDASIGGGDLKIEIDGDEVTLRATVGAGLAISRLGQGGGLSSVYQKLNAWDFDTILAVIVAGMGGKNPKELQGRVFKTGLFQLAPLCIEFVTIIANGGARPKEDENEPANPPVSG